LGNDREAVGDAIYGTKISALVAIKVAAPLVIISWEKSIPWSVIVYGSMKHLYTPEVKQFALEFFFKS